MNNRRVTVRGVAEDVGIANFVVTKRTVPCASLRMLSNGVNDDPDLLERVQLMAQPKSNHSNENGQQQPKEYAKFMCSTITGTWYIVSFCQKAVRSIRNNALDLCAVCSKQYEKNARNCVVTRHLTRHCLFVIVWPKLRP